MQIRLAQTRSPHPIHQWPLTNPTQESNDVGCGVKRGVELLAESVHPIPNQAAVDMGLTPPIMFMLQQRADASRAMSSRPVTRSRLTPANHQPILSDRLMACSRQMPTVGCPLVVDRSIAAVHVDPVVSAVWVPTVLVARRIRDCCRVGYNSEVCIASSNRLLGVALHPGTHRRFQALTRSAQLCSVFVMNHQRLG